MDDTEENKKTSTVLSDDEAARVIQRNYRRYADQSLFKKLKELVTFRNQGDPAALLRVINPLEAQLLDPAVGAHVRFRLGGFDWPPQIYYKIFLHSPVCDVNSYAPRNYADKVSMQLPPISKEQAEQFADKFGWYKRIENNGWRPISSLSPSAVDAITQMTSPSLPHKKLRAKIKPKKNIRKEVAKIKLARFLREHNEGQENENNNGKNDLDSGRGFPHISDEDLNDEELIEWANKLDIEQYMADWETLGTTGPSSELWWNSSDDENAYNEEESSGSEIDEAELMKLIS